MLGEMDKECVRRLASDDLIGIALGMFKERSVDTVAEAWAAAVQVMYLGTLHFCTKLMERM